MGQCQIEYYQLPQLNILLFSSKGQPWELAKAFDTSLPVSEFIGKDVIPDPGNVELVCKVNGELRQKENTNKLICPIPDMIGNIYLPIYITDDLITM